MSVGERVKAIREALGCTQTKMAQILNIAQSHLHRYEKNQSKLTSEKIENLYNIGINMDWLITGQGEMFRSLASKKSIDIDKEDVIYVPIKGYGISEGYMAQISAKLLGIAPEERPEGGYFIRARGNSMTPQIDSGDLLFVKDIATSPRYLEGLYIVNYDGEVYVKEIQFSEKEIIMRSFNKGYRDIIITNVEETDVYLQIIAKVIVIVKQA